MIPTPQYYYCSVWQLEKPYLQGYFSHVTELFLLGLDSFSLLIFCAVISENNLNAKSGTQATSNSLQSYFRGNHSHRGIFHNICLSFIVCCPPLHIVWSFDAVLLLFAFGFRGLGVSR